MVDKVYFLTDEGTLVRYNLRHWSSLDFDDRIFPFPGVEVFINNFQANTFDRAGRQAKFTARTQGGNNGMHLFGRTDNRINRTSLDTQCAAYAGLFINEGDLIKIDTQTGAYMERVKQ